VQVDIRTNTLVLKDIASVVAESVALVKAIDTPTPQVLIESKIVEAKLDFSRDLGAVWGIGSNPDATDTNEGFQRSGTGPPETTSLGSSFGFQQPNNVVVSNPITSSANGLMNLGGYILNNRFNLTLQLQAAESNGEGKVISSPRVVTLDNREAKIEQGVSIPYQTFQNGDAQLEFIDALLSLIVTPHITADKSIIMKIHVTRNAPGPQTAPTGAPSITKNEANTETLVKDGQTLVLGGIYVIDRSQTESRVPFLYRIPILGNAFKNDSILDKRRELLIFVTPRNVQTETAQN
jgi:type IV pilus assembly protein PilQ